MLDSGSLCIPDERYSQVTFPAIVEVYQEVVGPTGAIILGVSLRSGGGGPEVTVLGMALSQWHSWNNKSKTDLIAANLDFFFNFNFFLFL